MYIQLTAQYATCGSWEINQKCSTGFTNLIKKKENTDWQQQLVWKFWTNLAAAKFCRSIIGKQATSHILLDTVVYV